MPPVAKAVSSCPALSSARDSSASMKEECPTAGLTGKDLIQLTPPDNLPLHQIGQTSRVSIESKWSLSSFAAESEPLPPLIQSASLGPPNKRSLPPPPLSVSTPPLPNRMSAPAPPRR